MYIVSAITAANTANVTQRYWPAALESARAATAASESAAATPKVPSFLVVNCMAQPPARLTKSAAISLARRSNSRLATLE